MQYLTHRFRSFAHSHALRNVFSEEREAAARLVETHGALVRWRSQNVGRQVFCRHV